MMIIGLGRVGKMARKSMLMADRDVNLFAQPKRRSVWFALGLLVCLAAPVNLAVADSFRKGAAAYERHDYMRASAIFFDLAVAGDARAQTYLGYMYEYGKGVPQNFVVSAGWYRCASQQGFASAQYFLGLMYDKGRGVPQDYVLAYALLNLAVAGAGRERDHWVIVRDAVNSKLSLAERSQAQQLAFQGVPQQPCLPIVTGY
jgi:hypothetical protein